MYLNVLSKHLTLADATLHGLSVDRQDDVFRQGRLVRLRGVRLGLDQGLVQRREAKLIRACAFSTAEEVECVGKAVARSQVLGLGAEAARHGDGGEDGRRRQATLYSSLAEGASIEPRSQKSGTIVYTKIKV